MKSSRLKVVNLVKTCEACPSQWEANLEDGRKLYIRYRWGNFNVYLSKSSTDKVLDALQGDNIISIEDYGEPLGGYLDDDTMKSLLIEKFEF